MVGSSRQENLRESSSGGGNFVQMLEDNSDSSKPNQGLDDDPLPSSPMLKITVSHASTLHVVSVSSDSTFGDLKRVIAQTVNIEPQMQKLFFRGKEKEDCDHLQMAGVKDRSKVVLLEGTTEKEMGSEQTKQALEVSRGVADVAAVRAEVDQLSEKISLTQSIVSTGNRVDEKEIIYLTEMLMRQLLKLDSIEAEGDGKIQRKMEVRRVQSFVETMDALKARNSNPFSDYCNSVSVTTEWEEFDTCAGNITAPALRSSATVTQEWEQFD